MNTVLLSIIIVNYKSATLIDACLASFLPFINLPVEVLVIDNNSDDPHLSALLKKYPAIKFHQMGYNAGFARANNWGINNSGADILLLLNPDTIILQNSIADTYYLFKNSPYVAAGTQLLNEDRSPQISGNYFISGGINNFLPLPVIGKLLKWTGKLLKIKKTNLPDSNDLMEVDWINGAFLMVKRAVINKAGLLDEDFFLYAEEIEWCARLKIQGKLVIYGQYKVLHLQGESANQSFESSGKGYYNLYDNKGLQILVSNFLRIRKQYGRLWFLFHLFIYSIELVFLFLKQLILPFIGKDQLPKGMVRGFANNMLTLYKLTPKLIRNAPYFYKML